MSLQIAISLANEWEHKVREYKKTHKKAITQSLMLMIDREAEREASMNGMWNHRDIAHKACEILAERLGEKYEYMLPRKLV